MHLTTHAYARAGLIGNPSDGYFGKTISVIVRNFRAQVTCRESERLIIEPHQRDRLDYDNVQALVEAVDRDGYYGGVRLIKAAIKRFHDHCRACRRAIGEKAFALSYDTDIPVRVGLAGSSAIVIATLRALMQACAVSIDEATLATLALSVETEELGIGAGLQDRVIQAYEGVVFMDFEESLVRETGAGRYEPLDPAALPPLFVAYHEHLAEGTEVTHNDLRERYQRGDREVQEAMQRFAEFAQESHDLLHAGRGAEIGPLLDANYDLRAQLCPISAGNQELIRIGRAGGAHVKFAGSGGAIIGAYDGDPDRLARLRSEYEAFGAYLLTPEIA